MNIPEIKYSGDTSKFVEVEGWEEESLMLYKDNEFFEDTTAYVKFIKDCESAVRVSPDYKVFISYIKKILGINFCQVSSSIYDTDATVEMHHGPIFTLFDYCSIIVNNFLHKMKKINTCRIADHVLNEHFDLRVQVVMLATTNHEAAHNRDLFLHVNQGIGDLNEFVSIYSNSLDDVHKYKIWNYVNLCKSNPSFDTGYLDIPYIEKVIKI